MRTRRSPQGAESPRRETWCTRGGEDIAFRARATFGFVTTKRPFEITLFGVHRSLFDFNEQIPELDIAHETITTMQGAVRVSR